MWSNITNYTISVLEDPLTDSHIIDEIVSDVDEIRMYYMWRASVHPNLSHKSALKLSESHSYTVRQYLARNRNISVDILENLSNDPVYTVRYSAVRNPNATEIMRRKFLMADRKRPLEQVAQEHSPA